MGKDDFCWNEKFIRVSLTAPRKGIVWTDNSQVDYISKNLLDLGSVSTK